MPAGSAPGSPVHSDIVAPYLVNHGTEEQKHLWLPRMISGETVGAIAMTEPSAGSDLKAIRMQAARDGDGWRLSGQKTFITNGQNAGLVVTAVKTDPDAGARGISLFLVDASSPGYQPGRNLEKVGQHMADTSELYFEEVPVGPGDLLGAEGGGFAILMSELPRERTILAAYAQGAAEAAFDWTVEYVREREAFGKPLAALPEHALQARRAARRARHRPGLHRPLPRRAGRRPARCDPGGEGEVLADRAPGGASARWACSSTAATVTWRSIRSPAPGPTPACSASTAAPTRSCSSWWRGRSWAAATDRELDETRKTPRPARQENP